MRHSERGSIISDCLVSHGNRKIQIPTIAAEVTISQDSKIIKKTQDTMSGLEFGQFEGKASWP